MTVRHKATVNMYAATHAISTSTEHGDTLFPGATSCSVEAKQHCCG